MDLFIGLNIKYLCRARNLTEEEFGALFDTSQAVINTYTRGRSYPKPDVIQKICAYFRISIDDFFNVDMSSQEYTMQQLPQVREPAAVYESKDMVIAAQEKTITTLEKQVTLLEKENENLQKALKAS